MLSGPALEVFHCENVGNGERRLKGSLDAPCPTDHPGSWTFILGLLMVIMYPVGILLVFVWLLQVYQIPRMSQFKLDETVVSGLVAFYKKSQADTLAFKLALEIGGAASLETPENVSNSHSGRSEMDAQLAGSQFKARVKLMYEGATEGGKVELNATRLRHYVHQLGVRGANECQLDSLFVAYDDDGNGTLDCDEFEVMIREITEHCHLFKGTEG